MGTSLVVGVQGAASEQLIKDFNVKVEIFLKSDTKKYSFDVTRMTPDKKKEKGKGKEEEESPGERILGDEHWRRWEEKNKLPFVSLTLHTC